MKTIALLTDFGHNDAYVGIMKGVILGINPGVRMVDLTHGIRHQDVAQGALSLKAAYSYFPPQTIFVCVVDPGVGSQRQAILVKTKKYYFLAPDNGLLTPALDREKDFEIYSITNDRFFLKPVSYTFHGRDIFASVAAHLSKGVEPGQFGPRQEDCIRLKFPVPKVDRRHQKVDGEVIDWDIFGNIVTNIEPRHVEFMERDLNIQISGKTIKKVSASYADVHPGEYLAIWGSKGYLEISVNHGSAKEMLGVPKGARVEISG